MDSKGDVLSGTERMAEVSGQNAMVELAARMAREQPADPRMVGAPNPTRPVPLTTPLP